MFDSDKARPFKQRLTRLFIVLAGIAVGQAMLYGPSLLGRKILLPLDILATPNFYQPWTPELAGTTPHNGVLSDLVLNTEPGRLYLGEEIRAGRFPLWNPYQFAGVPNSLAKLSPFVMLGAWVKSPKILPWIELLAALVSGLGIYAFCRRVLQLSFWPAVFAAWCYPLTAFFVFWLGYGVAYPVVWLPWLLLAVHQTVSERRKLGGVGIAVTTCLVLVSGRLDVAGQVLLVSGLFAGWCYLRAYHHQWFSRQALGAGMAVVFAWGLGFMLASPDFLHTLEYSHTGARMMRRSTGEEDRPPVGLAALPQVVVPTIYGSTEQGSIPLFPPGQGNLLESSAAGYAGLLATLLVAPLAWCSRRHKHALVFWALLVFFSLSWCLNIPGLVHLFRLPGLKMMSHNRLVFATSFAILVMTAIGLEVLWQGPVRWRPWFWLPLVLVAVLGLWGLQRAVFLPEPIATRLGWAVTHGKNVPGVRDLADVRQVQAWFAWTSLRTGLLCALGVGGWLVIQRGTIWRSWFAPATGLLLIGDLLWFGRGQNSQCDPALYYPRIPLLEQIAQSTPGRVVGYGCFPAALAQTHGLRDIRGYDAIDPARLMDLMKIAASTNSPAFEYALTQWYEPQAKFLLPDGIRLSPILDMLGVRYVIFRGPPSAGLQPPLQSLDYWALANRSALPRAFVPKSVVTVANDRERLAKLAEPQFDPKAVAYVESPVNLPVPCLGSVEIVRETPNRVELAVHMQTPGLVVLADLWDKGWQAYLNGQAVPILRVNHALRGVLVPAQTATLEYRYVPASFVKGLWLSGFAAIVLLVWVLIGAWTRRTARAAAEGVRD